jgi:hypothetical protein
LVQVLFGFLLTIALLPGFEQLTGFELIAYYLAFAFAAISAVLFLAPGVHQRLRAPVDGIPRRSSLHVQRATQLAIAGTITFAIAMAAAVLLVSSQVLPSVAALILTGAITIVLLWTWFYMPLVQFKHE